MGLNGLCFSCFYRDVGPSGPGDLLWIRDLLMINPVLFVPGYRCGPEYRARVGAEYDNVSGK